MDVSICETSAPGIGVTPDPNFPRFYNAFLTCHTICHVCNRAVKTGVNSIVITCHKNMIWNKTLIRKSTYRTGVRYICTNRI